MADNILIELENVLPERRHEVLESYIRGLLVDFLQFDSLDEIADVEEFSELGADSIQAVEFKSLLDSSLACSLRTTILFDYPRIDHLVDHLLQEQIQFQSTAIESSQNQEVITEKSIEDSQPPSDLEPSIAITAIAGIFPGAENTEVFWQKINSGALLAFEGENAPVKFRFARIHAVNTAFDLHALNIQQDEFQSMARTQKLMLKVIADALNEYDLTPKDLSNKKTGVFIAAKSDDKDEPQMAYQIPLCNEISFRLDLKGPSELFNTFCTSVYVALHRAIQSIQAGECEQALVGGINTISLNEFNACSNAGLYDELLSQVNSTLSFSDCAQGFTRSEGVGVMLIQAKQTAVKQKRQVLALVRGSAVYHGGKGYSLEAPNAQALQQTIEQSLSYAKLTADSIDYIEAHGIGNMLADAIELNALNRCYTSLSNNPQKRWQVSSIKPTIGHPEIAAGMASIIKVIKAFEHKTIPGLSGFNTINPDIAPNHALILQTEGNPWLKQGQPRRAALNSFAIGGVNSHLILEQSDEIESNLANGDNELSNLALDTTLTPNDSKSWSDKPYYLKLSELFAEIFKTPLADIDLETSFVQYGFDSISVMQFVTALNEAFAIHLRMGQVLSIDSVNDFIKLIDEQLVEAHHDQPPGAKVETEIQPTENPVQESVSEVQKGLWYIQQANPTSTSFNVPLTFKSLTPINQKAFERAMLWMLNAYPILTARFLQNLDSEQVSQHLTEVTHYQINHYIQHDHLESLNSLLYGYLREPFDLENTLPIRSYLIECKNDNQYFVFLVIHHIVFDGISGALFIGELWKKYHQFNAGIEVLKKSPDLAFFDYVGWERNYLGHDQAQKDLTWWKTVLKDLPPALPLPYDKNIPDHETQGIGCETVQIESALFQGLQTQAKHHHVNFSVYLLAVFNLFLSKLCQQNDIVVSSPVLGRPKRAYEKSIGCYINIIVTRTQVSPEQNFSSLLQQTKLNFINGIDHGYYPFSTLMPELGLTLTNPDEAPFPVSFTYQNIFDQMLNSQDDLAEIEPLFEVYQEVEDNYTLEIYDLRDQLKINLKYKRKLFAAPTIKRHLDSFLHLLKTVVLSSENQIQAYEMLPEAERNRQLMVFNQTVAAYPKHKSFSSLFVMQAEKTPNAVALHWCGQQMTYQQLLQKSDDLAVYLQVQGIETNDIVAVCIPRSMQMIVAILAVLRSGGVYLPIDPATSVERINFILTDASAKLLLTDATLKSNLLSAEIESQCRIEVVEQIQHTHTQLLLKNGFQPENGAYVIYTSGSTGHPKGVMISQQSLVNLCFAMQTAYDIHPEDRVVQFAALSFDMSVEEIFPYLLCGAGVVIRQETDIEAENFYRLVMDNKASIINIPPLFYQVIDGLHDEKKAQLFNQLRLVAFGGEALPESILKAVQDYDVRIFNAYGPTECTVNASIAELTHSSVPTIGKPILNTQLYVLGQDTSLLPIGVCGELYIAGDGVSLGYLNQPSLTQQKFVDNPFGAGKMYKTGDIVRWMNDGLIEYIGRIDDQVKIRGYRVELGEVESSLVKHVEIDNAVAIVQAHAQGNKLIAFYTLENLDSIDHSQIRSFLRQSLPDYMVPSAFVQLQSVPLTRNGKVDRKQLQQQSVEINNATQWLAPNTETEKQLAKIWADVLDVDQVGLLDNFFDLGGHSLLAVQIIIRINKTLSVEVSLTDFFAAENIQNLAVNVDHLELMVDELSLMDFEQQGTQWII